MCSRICYSCLFERALVFCISCLMLTSFFPFFLKRYHSFCSVYLFKYTVHRIIFRSLLPFGWSAWVIFSASLRHVCIDQQARASEDVVSSPQCHVFAHQNLPKNGWTSLLYKSHGGGECCKWKFQLQFWHWNICRHAPNLFYHSTRKFPSLLIPFIFLISNQVLYMHF